MCTVHIVIATFLLQLLAVLETKKWEEAKRKKACVASATNWQLWA